MIKEWIKLHQINLISIHCVFNFSLLYFKKKLCDRITNLYWVFSKSRLFWSISRLICVFLTFMVWVYCSGSTVSGVTSHYRFLLNEVIGKHLLFSKISLNSCSDKHDKINAICTATCMLNLTIFWWLDELFGRKAVNIFGKKFSSTIQT